MDALDVLGLDPSDLESPTPFIIGKVTGLAPLDLRVIVPDYEAIGEAVESWATDNDLSWDPISAHESLRPDLPAVRDASDDELYEANERCLEACDALIVHGFAGGTIMLGWLVRCALARAAPLPVLVLAHKGEKLSRPLNAIEKRYSNLTISRFNDGLEIFRKTRDWLSDATDQIRSGPERRRAVEEAWSDAAQRLHHAWFNTSESVRAEVTAATGLDERDILEFVETPTHLGELSSHRHGLALSMLSEAAAMASLDSRERDAFEFWAADKGTDYTQAVLNAAIKERSDGRVARSAAYLGQPAAWERFATRWRSMASRPPAR